MSGDLARRKAEISNGQLKRRRFKIRQGGKKKLGRNFLTLLISRRIYSLQGYCGRGKNKG